MKDSLCCSIGTGWLGRPSADGSTVGFVKALTARPADCSNLAIVYCSSQYTFDSKRFLPRFTLSILFSCLMRSLAEKIGRSSADILYYWKTAQSPRYMYVLFVRCQGRKEYLVHEFWSHDDRVLCLALGD